MNPPELLTSSEVATLLRVSVPTVSRWAKAGRLTYIRTLGGHRRFHGAQVRALLNGEAERQRRRDELLIHAGAVAHGGWVSSSRIAELAPGVSAAERDEAWGALVAAGARADLDEVYRLLDVLTGPVYPAPGSQIPGQEGYVVATCGHRVAVSEWRAGFRSCERCNFGGAEAGR